LKEKLLDVGQLEIPGGDDNVTSVRYAARRYEVQSDGSEWGKLARARTSSVAGTCYVFLCPFSLCTFFIFFLSHDIFPSF
jgi:hypothetical protein